MIDRYDMVDEPATGNTPQLRNRPRHTGGAMAVRSTYSAIFAGI
jgi:hypothetical protein